MNQRPPPISPAETQRRVNALSRVTLFKYWSSPEIAEFAKHLRLVAYDSNEVIFWEGDPGDTLYIILQGQVVVSRRLKGDVETVICRLNDGDFFGELDVIDDLSASANVQTETPCIFYTIGRDTLYDQLEANPKLYSKFLLALLKELAKRLRATNNKLLDAMLWGIDATSLDTG